MAEIELLQEILLKFGEKTPTLVVLFLVMKYIWPDMRDIIMKWLDVKGMHDDEPDPVTSRLDKLVESISALTVEVRGMARENAMLGQMAVNSGMVAATSSTRVPGPLTRPPVSPSGAESRDAAALAETVKT